MGQSLSLTPYKAGESMSKRYLRLFILGGAVLSLGIGISRGEVQEVLFKAINLCLECIGIG